MFEDDHAPVTLSEIYHQADSCRQTVALAGERSRVLEPFLPLDQYTDIIITGCGSSHHVSMCASFAWSRVLERPVTAVASSELLHFPDHYLAQNSKPLIIAISRSGDTTEVKRAVQRLKRDYRARSIAITTGGSDVAGVCDAAIVFGECAERSVVMTQAFTCILAGLYLLAIGVDGPRPEATLRRFPC